MKPNNATESQSLRVRGRVAAPRPDHSAMSRKKGAEKSMRSASNVAASTAYA